MFCTACAAANPSSRRSCGACGTALEPPAGRAAPPSRRRSWRAVVLAALPPLLLAGALAASGDIVGADEEATRRALWRALAAGDLAEAERLHARVPDASADASLRLLATRVDDADAAHRSALAAIGRGAWDRVGPALSPIARALPADLDARDVLELARSRREHGWETEYRAATERGDHLAADRALGLLAAARPHDAVLAARLAAARNDAAPIALARDKALWLVTPGGADAALITDAVPVARPVWSPDRTRLAFVSIDPYDGRAAGTLYVVGAEDGTPEAAYRAAHPNAVPSWSPDGRFVALTSAAGWDLRREAGILSVHVVDLGSGAARDVSSATGRHGTSPAWSPDGRHVAFIARPVLDDPRASPLSGPAEVWLWSAGDGTARPLTADEAPGANRLLWSPDGRWLVVLSRERGLPGESGRPSATIAAIDPESGTLTTIASGVVAVSSSWSPAWSPDGSWLAWIDAPGDIVLLGRDGRDLRVETGHFLAGSVSWSPGGRSLIAPGGEADAVGVRLDGIGDGLPRAVEVTLPYDLDWPTGAPQWSPVVAPPDDGARPITGSGLDRRP